MAHRHGWMGRILAVLLASAMIVTSVPEAALTVRAAEDTETVDASADAGATDDQTTDLSENEWGGVEIETPIPSEESNETEETAPVEEAAEEEGLPEENTPAEESPAEEEASGEDTPAEPAEEEMLPEELPADEEALTEEETSAEEAASDEEIPQEEAPAEEIDVTLPEVMEGEEGTSVETAIPLEVGKDNAVSGTVTSAQKLFYKVTLEKNKFYILNSKKSAEVGTQEFKISFKGENGYSQSLWNASYINSIKNSEDYVYILGEQDTDLTVYFQVEVGSYYTNVPFELALYEASVSYEATAAADYKINVAATMTTDPSCSGKVGNALYVLGTYTDMFGNSRTRDQYRDGEAAIENGTGVLVSGWQTAQNVLAGTSCEIEVGISGYGSGSSNPWRKIQTVSAAVNENTSLDASKFVLEQPAKSGTSYTLDYSYNGGALDKDVTIYYAPRCAGLAATICKADKKFYSNSTTATFASSNVSEGVPYVFGLYVDGVLVKFGDTTDYVFGDSVYNDPEIEITPGTFGVHIKYSISKKDNSEFSGTGKLAIICRERAEEAATYAVTSSAASMTLSEDKLTFTYEKDYSGASYTYLKSGATYDFVFSFIEGSGSSVNHYGGKPVTIGNPWTIEPTAIGSTMVRFSVSADDTLDFTGLTSSSSSVSAYFYYRKQGERAYKQAKTKYGYNAYISISKTGDTRKWDVTVSGLEPETAYEFAWFSSSSANSSASSSASPFNTFTASTKAETRRITGIESNYVSETGFSLNVGYAGCLPGGDDDGYLTLFYRPVADEGEEPEEYKTPNYPYSLNQAEGTAYLYAENLSFGTTYEYIVVLAGKECTSPDDPGIVDRKADTITTSTSDMQLNYVSHTTGITSAEFSYLVIRTQTNSLRLYFNLFYREKADGEEKEWLQADTVSNTYTAGSISEKVTISDGLKSNTRYEYKAVVSTSEISKPNAGKGIVGSRTGVFKTQEETRKLGEVSASAGITSGLVTAKFSGGLEGTRTYFKAYYKKKADETYRSGSSKDSDSASGSVELRISGLEPETEYDFIVVMSDKEVVGSYDDAAEYLGKKSDSFTTKADTRTIKAVEAVPSYTRAVFTVTFEGGVEGDTTNFTLFYRKKGDASFSTRTGSSTLAEGDVEIEKTGLEKDTDYEYFAVLWKNASKSSHTPGAEDPYATSETDVKEFKTKAEGRSISDVNPVSAFTSVKFEVSFTGSFQNEYTYANAYVRKKGSKDAYAACSSAYSQEAEGIIEVRSGQKLEKETDYEYIVLLAEKSFSVDDPDVDLAGGDAKAKGIIGKKTGFFATKEDTRKIIDPGISAKFTSVTVKTGFTDSIPGENTHMTMFYAKAGSSSYEKVSPYSGSSHSELEKYDVTYKFDHLEVGTKYKAVFLLSSESIEAYTDIDNSKVIRKDFEFSTQEESRVLKSVVASASYTSMMIRAAFEGNSYEDYAYVGAYYRQKGSGSYTYQFMYSGNDESADKTILITGLEPNKTYEYAVVFSDQSLPGSMTDSELNSVKNKDKWLKKSSCPTLKADFNATVSYNAAKSSPGYTVVNVKLGGDSIKNYDSMIYAELTFHPAGGSDVTASVSVKNSTGYSSDLITKQLSQGVEYTVTKVSLYFYESNGTKTSIQTLTKDKDGNPFPTFTTKANTVKASSVKLSAGELYLNAGASNIGNKVTAAISPANAVKGLSFSYEPTGIAYASYSTSAGTTVITVTPVKAGVTTIKVSPSDNPDKAVELTVNVVDYRVVDDEPIVIQKGQPKKPEIRSKQGEEYTGKVTGEITGLEGGRDVVSLESDGSLKGINIGTSNVIMMVDGHYPVAASVEVIVPYKGYIIDELQNEQYPAQQVTAALKETKATVAAGESYVIEGYLSPMNSKLSQNRELLIYTSDTDKVTVDNGNGIISTSVSDSAYDAEITVTPAKDEDNQPLIDLPTSKILLHVAPVPEGPESLGYVITNVADVLDKVPLGEVYPGWAWDAPKDSATLFNTYTAEATDERTFKASYTSETGKNGLCRYYPTVSKDVTLHTVTMTDVGVAIGDGSDRADKKVVVEWAEKETSVNFYVQPDGFNVSPYAVYDQLFGDSKYDYALECISANKGNVQFIKHTDATEPEKVIFKDAGTYEFKIDVLSKGGEGSAIHSDTRTVEVVKEPVVSEIIFAKAKRTDGTEAALETVAVDGENFTIHRDRDEIEAAKGLILTVKAVDASGREIPETDVELSWDTSDGVVADVSFESGNTRTATIKALQEGHTTITVTAKDARGTTAHFKYEYQNKAPRVDKTSLKVNTVYDDTTDGKELAYWNGYFLEIAPVYGEPVQSVKFYDRTQNDWNDEPAGTQERKEFYLTRCDNQDYHHYIARTTSKDVKAGSYKLWMIVSTESGPHPYPMTITVISKAPSVSAKTVGKINLFYVNRPGQESISVTTSRDYFSKPVTFSWKDYSEDVYGFNVDSNGRITYPNVRVNNRALQDPKVAIGTLTMYLKGIRDGSIEKKNFKIATCYKKPALVTNSSSTNIMSSVEYCSGRSFSLYNKTEKQGVGYSTSPYDWNCYTSLETNASGITLSKGSYISYTYYGSKKSETIKMTVDNAVFWREPLTVTHKIKDIAPKAVLSPGTIVTNNTLDDLFLNNRFYISIKNYGYISLADLEIKGNNGDAQDLIDNDFIGLHTGSSKTYLTFNQNAMKVLGGSLGKGSYKFKLTPYYKAIDGKIKKLNTLTLTIKVVDQPISAVTTAKGSLDIAKKSYRNTNAVKISDRVLNLPDGSSIKRQLTGEYADYFSLYSYAGQWYVGFAGTSYSSSAYNKNLKAGMTIPLSINYTITVPGADGEPDVVTTVNGGVFYVKTTQSAPKVKVTSGNNQTLYAAAAKDVCRFAYIRVPDTSQIATFYGALDCDKDGKADIVVLPYDTSYWYYRTVKIKVLDMDAVYASAKGTTLSIPVTVRMRGADGISRDSSTVIKVKVKR